MNFSKTRSLLFFAFVAGIAGLCIFLYTSTGAVEWAKKENPGNNDITSVMAFAMWQADPENVKILDVRTVAEYAIAGHPPMAHNIPLAFWTRRFDPVRSTYEMQKNPDFINQVKNRFSVEDTVLVLCRSGYRSGLAAELMRNAGFSKVHNISDGFEGHRIQDEKKNATGNSTAGGWKNSGAAWTYTLEADLVHSP